MQPPIRGDHPIRGLFTGLVENAFFTELGLCEPRLTSYLADLMVEFIHVDRLTILRTSLGRRLDQVAALVNMLDDPGPCTTQERERHIYRHIGDFALFWTGIFPEHLRMRRSGGDLICAYVEQGKRSYAASAKLTGEEDQPPSTLLTSLSEEFETCVHALGLVRRSWQDAQQSRSGGPDLIY